MEISKSSIKPCLTNGPQNQKSGGKDEKYVLLNPGWQIKGRNLASLDVRLHVAGTHCEISKT